MIVNLQDGLPGFGKVQVWWKCPGMDGVLKLQLVCNQEEKKALEDAYANQENFHPEADSIVFSNLFHSNPKKAIEIAGATPYQAFLVFATRQILKRVMERRKGGEDTPKLKELLLAIIGNPRVPPLAVNDIRETSQAYRADPIVWEAATNRFPEEGKAVVA